MASDQFIDGRRADALNDCLNDSAATVAMKR